MDKHIGLLPLAFDALRSADIRSFINFWRGWLCELGTETGDRNVASQHADLHKLREVFHKLAHRRFEGAEDIRKLREVADVFEKHGF